MLGNRYIVNLINNDFVICGRIVRRFTFAFVKSVFYARI